MTRSGDVETVERTIRAAPQRSRVARRSQSASRHRWLWHGEGGRDAPERVELGDTFGMGMKRGVPYSTHNVVIEFEDNRRLAWQRGDGSDRQHRGTRCDLALRRPVKGGTTVHNVGLFASTRIQADAASHTISQQHGHGEDPREHREAPPAPDEADQRRSTWVGSRQVQRLLTPPEDPGHGGEPTLDARLISEPPGRRRRRCRQRGMRSCRLCRPAMSSRRRGRCR